MERHQLDVILEAEQPIKHLAESFGNTGVLMSRRIRQRGGGFARVPCVSGDAMRHGIREASARIELAVLGIDQKGALTEAALRLFFAGGMVTGDGDAGSVKMGEYRLLCEMVPSLGFLGGCAMNRTIPGRLHCEDATLICAESAHFLPAWTREVGEVEAATHATFRESVEEVQRVRMDPSLNPTLRNLLDDGARAQIEARLDRSEKASAEGDAAGKEAAKSTMMPRRFQRVAQGSLFVWRVTVTLLDDLDRDTFYAALFAFLADMRVGGGHATGHGRMRVARGDDGRPLFHRTVLRSSADVQGAVADAGLVPVDTRVGDLLTAHLTERKSKIVEYLKTVNA